MNMQYELDLYLIDAVYHVHKELCNTTDTQMTQKSMILEIKKEKPYLFQRVFHETSY